MSTTSTQTATGQFVWHDHMSGDEQKARDFYGNLFGWTYEAFKTDMGDYPMITKDGAQHGGFGPAQGDASPHWVGHVVVDDADAAGKRAESAGGSVLAAMDIPEVGRFAVIRDPQGAVISAFAPQGESTAGQGQFVWDELHTSDIEAAKSFYPAVFGWTVNEMDMGDMGKYTLFRVGDTDRAGAMQQMPATTRPRTGSRTSAAATSTRPPRRRSSSAAPSTSSRRTSRTWDASRSPPTRPARSSHRSAFLITRQQPGQPWTRSAVRVPTPPRS